MQQQQIGKEKSSRHAHNGAYGAIPYSRVANDAKIILRAIQTDFADAPFVTREDLLGLAAFSAVSTITRYSYVCQGVRHLLETGKLIEQGRSELCLPSRTRQYESPADLAKRHGQAIERAVRAALQAEKITHTMAIVERWRSDAALTVHAKRVAVRTVLRRLVRSNQVRQGPPGFYLAPGAASSSRT